jgi:hypothetical protein
MKYKIQTRSVNGWADLKVSDDHENYSVELFDSIAEALHELNDLGSLHGLDHYRVVCQTMPADDNLY